MYQSNLYKKVEVESVDTESKVVLVGNSANPSNNHADIFNKLSNLKDQNFNIICPLSYGNNVQAAFIAQLGRTMFGVRFTPLLDFMPFNEYLNTLAKVDIAIFAHERQQGMGNMITLLSLGKKVYMRGDTSPYALFEKLNIKVFNIEDLSLESSELSDLGLIEEYFSYENLLTQWRRIVENNKP
jgi:hypothetical protein